MSFCLTTLLNFCFWLRLFWRLLGFSVAGAAWRLWRTISVPTEKGETMYRSPINVLISDIQHQIAEQQDEEVYKAVVSVGINVDRDELIRALAYDRHQYMKGYADGKADATPKWIPVTERLPEELRRVLAYVKEDGYDRYAFAVYEYEKWWDCFYIHPVNVTHWMPLPEPPEGE
jgi:hypothetical protein